MTRSLIFFIFLINSILIKSQQVVPSIEKSKEKIIINGNIYYLHTIKPGQTLYSISKAYNVSIDDILSANPGINPSQIKEGTHLKIPASNLSYENTQNNNNKNNYILHKVKQGETLYFLSKKYNVEIDEIIRANEGLETLKADQIIKIPRNIENIKKDSIRYITYELNKKDTLYVIAKKYNTTVADIIALNPELKDGIKKGLKIKIPVIIKTDTSELNIISKIDCEKKPEEKNEYRFVILTPFLSDSIFHDNYINENTISFYNFYKGVLIALDSLKKIGKTTYLKIIEVDPKNTVNNINNILLFKPDFVIYINSEIDSVIINNCQINNIPLLIPFETETKGKNCSNCIKILQANYLEYIFDYIKPNINNKKINLIIVNDKITKSKNLSCSIENSKGNTPENIKLNVININDSIIYNIQKAIDTINQNIIFLNSTNEGTVSVLLSRLNFMNRHFNFNIIGLKEWLYFSKIDIDLLHKLNIKILSPIYIDYNNKDVKHFLFKNVNLFKTEPLKTNYRDILTFAGFDIIFMTTDLIKKYNNIITCLNKYYYNGLLTNYYLVREKNNEIINKSYILISYEKDYTVKKEIKFTNTDEKLFSKNK